MSCFFLDIFWRYLYGFQPDLEIALKKLATGSDKNNAKNRDVLVIIMSCLSRLHVFGGWADDASDGVTERTTLFF